MYWTRPAHISELEENRKWARSTLYGGNLDAGERPHNEPENLHTGKFSQEKVVSYMDRRKSSVSFRAPQKKSSQVAFSRLSIMTQVCKCLPLLRIRFNHLFLRQFRCSCLILEFCCEGCLYLQVMFWDLGLSLV